MVHLEISAHRLQNQGISSSPFRTPGAAVRSLVAVQAQDYAAAKWALGLRMQTATDQVVELAFANGSILRTHVMRPTWHFVAPEDIRWLLNLTSPRVHAANAYQYRRLGLDATIFRRSDAVLAEALRGGRQLTRAELGSKLRQAGIDSSGLRLAYLIMSAELDGIICSGARRGKQFTYALLEERVPETKMLDHDAALAELVQRYFASHGPATEQDLVWWSGLTRADVRAGLEMVKGGLGYEVIGGKAYWFAPTKLPADDNTTTLYLLPNFDEYMVGYTDRSAVIDDKYADKVLAREGILTNVIVIKGQVAGYWRREVARDRLRIELKSFEALTSAESRAVAAAARRYAAFLQKQLEFSTTP